MAVGVGQHFTMQRGEWNLFRELAQEIAQQIDLFAQSRGARVRREQIHEFVAKHGRATGLEHDDRQAVVDFLRQGVHGFDRTTLGLVEHAEVVEGTSAADVGLRNDDLEAGGFEHVERSQRRVGKKVVVESVGPEQDLRSVRIFRRARANDLLET